MRRGSRVTEWTTALAKKQNRRSTSWLAAYPGAQKEIEYEDQHFVAALVIVVRLDVTLFHATAFR